jgi:hypothetical protein
MIRGIYIEYIDIDRDYVRLRVTASNGMFSGSVAIYADISALSDAAVKLTGFPRKSLDQCMLEFGTFQAGYAGGGVRMIFKCIDGAGHIQLQLKMESDHNEDIPSQSVSLLLPIEAASIDTFVHELTTMDADRKATATLLSY